MATTQTTQTTQVTRAVGRADRVRRPVTEADIVLAARVRASDRDAFTDLYRSTVDRVAGFVAARVWQRDRDLVDDLVQDAYCLALAEPHRIDPDLVGSMYRLAARAMTNHSWSQRRYLRAARTLYTDRTATAANPATAATTASPDGRRTIAAVTLTGAAAGGFGQALARLTTDQRRAVQLRYLDGHTRTEVAARMRRTVDAVRWLENRALRRLHDLCTTASSSV
ncbi:RNA polymerase sigma factor [Dactylosporangium sp. NPDC048998]|uniref:RNA polymerase sigma factor n=1 Tax=Dactylosporangium sp. NPDC048998 TaxID=3363976 RepID=UPI0037126232